MQQAFTAEAQCQFAFSAADSPAIMLVAIFLVMVPCVSAQAPAQDMKQANDLYQAKDWTGSAAAYGAIVKALQRQPMEMRGFDMVCRSVTYTDTKKRSPPTTKLSPRRFPHIIRNGKAIGLHLRANGARERQSVRASYQHPRHRRRIHAIKRVHKTGIDGIGLLRDDPRFAKLIDSADRAARPCDFDSHYREFDFWLGEWEVRTAAGSVLAGNSVIEKTLGSCVILENWTGAGGGSGKSFNIYNATSKQWEQIWVDATGSLTKYSGGIKDGAMDYYADSASVELARPSKCTFNFSNSMPG